MENQNPNYYAILTAEVRYDKRLSSSAKLLYAEITALTNMNGKCFATNMYFAELYGVSKNSVQKWLTQLEEYGYIERLIQYKPGTKEIEKRLIRVCISTRKENFTTVDIKKDTTPNIKNYTYNNTTKVEVNNTLTESNNINLKNVNKLTQKNEKNFTPPTKDEVKEYARWRDRIDLANDFYDYYEAGGWKDGKGNSIKSWKQKFITWERFNPERKKSEFHVEW